jgi:hypothetical protein
MRKYFVMSSGCARREQHVREQRIHQRVRVAAGAMQQQHRVVHVAGGVAVRRAEGEVVQLEFRQRLIAAKVEVRQHNSTIDRGPSDSRRLRGRIRTGKRHCLATAGATKQKGCSNQNPVCAL